MVSLEEELNLIKDYIELEQLRFENKFDFIIEKDAELDTSDFLVPPLITNPIVENAIWHGLLPITSKLKPELVINIQIKNNALLIIISDNGVGRTEVKKDNKSKSYGISITKQRLQNINYLYKSSIAQLEIEDLQSSTNTAIGTRVIIQLPVVNTHND
jgi:LytS/YehU family sensor histidine kinase